MFIKCIFHHLRSFSIVIRMRYLLLGVILSIIYLVDKNSLKQNNLAKFAK